MTPDDVDNLCYHVSFGIMDSIEVHRKHKMVTDEAYMDELTILAKKTCTLYTFSPFVYFFLLPKDNLSQNVYSIILHGVLLCSY